MDYEPGSREDFDRLYRDSYPRIFRTLYAMLGNAAAAEDCAQDTFEKAFKAWPRFRPDKPAEAWLQRIAFNSGISHKRRAKLREVGEILKRFGRPVGEPDPADQAEKGWAVRLLSKLPPEQSAAFVLRHYHGYTNREIAAAMGVSERTIGSRLARASAALERQTSLLDSEPSSVDRVKDRVID